MSSSSESVSSKFIPTPPDGGYGWVIVAVAFLIHVIVDGIAFTFGVFYVEFLDYFGQGRGKTALIGSLLTGFYLLSAPFASALVNKFGTRRVSIAGGILATVGFLISVLSPNIDFLIFTYGVLGGTGLGLAYLPCIVSVSFYFQKRRSLATGIAVCGAGVGCFIFAPFGRLLLDTFDWKNSILIVSGIVLNLCACGAMLRPLEPAHKKRKPRTKNILDHLLEQAENVRGRKSLDSEYSASAHQVKDQVQEVKLAREKALRDEDSEPEYSSTSNSERKLDSTEIHIPDNEGRNGRLSFDPVLTPQMPTDEVTDKVSPNGLDSTDNCMDDIDETCLILGKESEVPDMLPPKSAIYKQGFKLDRAKYSSLPNVLAECGDKRQSADDRLSPHDPAVCTKGSKTAAEKINKNGANDILDEDYARPMYRKDIFYGGSILHIPEFQSQPTLAVYNKSITSIPGMLPHESETCTCIPKSVRDTLKEMMDISLLKDPIFLMACLGNLFAAMGHFIPYIYITDRARSLGIEDTKAAFLISVIGITNTVGRILAGSLADVKGVNSLALHNCALVMAGVACIFNMFSTTYISCCMFAAVFGLCVATWITLTSIILCDLLGLHKLSNSFGLLTMTRGFASIIGPPVAGMVYDSTGDYNTSFHVGGVLLIIAGLLCFLLHLPYFQRRSVANRKNGDTNRNLPSADKSLDCTDNE